MRVESPTTPERVVSPAAVDFPRADVATRPARAGTRSRVDSRSALSHSQRVVYWLLTGLWVLVATRFLTWWLQRAHHGAWGLYLPATVALSYLTVVLPSFYWFFVGRMRRPRPPGVPPGRRVALITLCVPSHETFDVIARQLRALAAVTYPHDSWVLDEGGDAAVQALAAQLGVRYFTRRGRARWNGLRPPFQAKTKAGNVNAWLDHTASQGIEYDVFVQFDIDHTPHPEYVHRTLGYFDDPEVSWVQAPSVCSNRGCWIARGLAEQEVLLQGPLQMGFYGHTRTPFIIGSHTSYRTAAVRAIGGFQTTRAEDHLDTVVLAAAGYRGVYLPEIIAEGDGPTDFGTYLGQQFAWAYSMVQIFLRHTPSLIARYTRAQAFQFLMAQSWYTLWSVSIAAMWVLPVIALLSDRPIAHVVLPEFLVYYLAVILTSSLLWWWSRRWFQPSSVHLTWRGVLLEAARWPIVLWAVLNAAFGVARPYMITVKGNRSDKPPPGWRLYGPYLLLIWASVGAVALFELLRPQHTPGHLVLVLGNALVVVVLVLAILSLELSDLARRQGGAVAALRLRAGSMFAILVSALAMAAATYVAWVPLVEAFG